MCIAVHHFHWKGLGLGSNTVRHELKWKWKSLREWKSYRQKVTGCWFVHCTLYLWLRAAMWKNPSSGPVDLEIESSAGLAWLSALLPSTDYTRHAKAMIFLQRESCVSDSYFLSLCLKQHFHLSMIWSSLMPSKLLCLVCDASLDFISQLCQYWFKSSFKSWLLIRVIKITCMSFMSTRLTDCLLK